MGVCFIGDEFRSRDDCVLCSKNGETSLVERSIRSESSLHGDIVEADFVDAYQNLTLKSLCILQWVTQHCSTATYLLKADSDMYVNVPLLVQALESATRSRRKTRHVTAGTDNKGNGDDDVMFILGSANRGGVRPIRSSGHKWFVPRDEFPARSYPPYVDGGGAYAMTSSAAAAIRGVSPYVDLVRLEDVYVTGLCAGRAGVELVNHAGFSSRKLDISNMTSSSFSKQITASQYSPREIRDVHRAFVEWRRRGR